MWLYDSLTLNKDVHPRHFFSAILLCVAFTGCMKWDYGDYEELSAHGHGLFITNEGNFQYGNATLSYYDPAIREVQNEAFFRANGMKLGDVAQSMAMYGRRVWIVVNNSHVVFAINPDNFKETGRIENMASPRHIHFVNDTKAYVTQLWDNRIFIVNPQRYEITGYITVPDMPAESGSTEQMVQLGDYVYCNCWSYQNSIIKIDTRTDRVVDRLETGIQPRSIALDKYGKLWVLSDGGFEGNPLGKERPSLTCIDTDRFAIERRFRFNMQDAPAALATNATADTLYWVNRHVWRMPVESAQLPDVPFLRERDSGKYYSLTVSPYNSDVYVADAIDYQQQGVIYRYSSDGHLLDSFGTGITPGAFCWK